MNIHAAARALLAAVLALACAAPALAQKKTIDTSRLMPTVGVSEGSANGVRYRLYSNNMRAPVVRIGGVPQPTRLVLLARHDGSLAPSDEITLLDSVARTLVTKKSAYYVVAIVGHRAREGGDWNAEGDKLVADYRHVYDHLKQHHPRISERSTAIGGISFAGFQLGGRAAWDGWVTSLGGVTLINAGIDSNWASRNLKVPVVNRICANDTYSDSPNGNAGGNTLMRLLPATVKPRSDAKTDPACNGHTFRQQWAGELATGIDRLF